MIECNAIWYPTVKYLLCSRISTGIEEQEVEEEKKEGEGKDWKAKCSGISKIIDFPCDSGFILDGVNHSRSIYSWLRIKGFPYLLKELEEWKKGQIHSPPFYVKNGYKYIL